MAPQEKSLEIPSYYTHTHLLPQYNFCATGLFPSYYTAHHACTPPLISLSMNYYVIVLVLCLIAVP